MQHLKGVLKSYIDASPSVRRLFIRIEEPPGFDFQPGQYLSLRIPHNGKTTVSSYSIASAPDRSNVIEICFKHGGSTVADILYSCPVGTRLDLSGPSGRFVLRRPVKHDCAFIATGTGITPLRSMLQALFHEGTAHQVTLILGAREEHDLLYREEFEYMERQHTNFRFLPTLSRPGANWRGQRGRVQTQVRRRLCHRSGVEFYICGVDSMVAQVRALLTDCGHPRQLIHSERHED